LDACVVALLLRCRCVWRGWVRRGDSQRGDDLHQHRSGGRGRRGRWAVRCAAGAVIGNVDSIRILSRMDAAAVSCALVRMQYGAVCALACQRLHTHTHTHAHAHAHVHAHAHARTLAVGKSRGVSCAPWWGTDRRAQLRQHVGSGTFASERSAASPCLLSVVLPTLYDSYSDRSGFGLDRGIAPICGNFPCFVLYHIVRQRGDDRRTEPHSGSERGATEPDGAGDAGRRLGLWG
jgi:hypothetical protein